MKRTITIDVEDLRQLMMENTIYAVNEVLKSLREGEVIISQSRYNQGEKAIEQIAAKDDVLLSGVEVKDLLGCSSSQITKLKNKGILEPIYLMGSRTPKYSKNTLMKMIKTRTVPCFKK